MVMMTSSLKLAVRCGAVVLVAACGPESAAPLAGDTPDAGAGLDAGPADAPPADAPGPIERLDWRGERAAPFATTSVTIPSAELFALPGERFVTRSECRNLDGCTFTWRAPGDPVGLRRERMTSVTSSALSPDGRRAALVALDEIEQCDDGMLASQVARGTLQSLELATGAVELALPLRSNFWSASAFTPLSDWLFAAPIEGRACIASATRQLSVTPPFGPPPGLDAKLELVQAVDARRWVVLHGADLGLVDPLAPQSYRFLADDPSRFDVSRGWVHVYVGFADLAEEVISIPPNGVARQTVLRDEDWHPFGALGRWIRVCRIQQPEGYRDCRVVDAQGEVAPVNFRATFAPDHPDDVVLLSDGAVVFVGPVDGGGRAVQRLDVATGRREVLHPGDGALRSLGDGAAALLVQDGSAWLIEAGREELLAKQVSHVVSVPRLPVLVGRAPGRQDDVAALVLPAMDGRFTLAMLDVRARRLVTMTDDLFFVRPRGLPFAFNDGCGQPWTARLGGSVIEGLSQPAHQLFFVEGGAPATLWLVPIDLASPPRRLAELTGPPEGCHAPLASPAGDRFGFAENGPDGTTARITLSATSK
jgi:hypothetical protein